MSNDVFAIILALIAAICVFFATQSSFFAPQSLSWGLAVYAGLRSLAYAAMHAAECARNKRYY